MEVCAVVLRVHVRATIEGWERYAWVRRGGTVVLEWLVGAESRDPVLEHGRVVVVAAHVGEGDLVGAPRALHRLAIDLGRTGPALRGAQDDHRPAGALCAAVDPGRVLDGSDLVEGHVERRCELLVHLRGVVAGPEVRPPPVPPAHGAELVAAHAGEALRVWDPVPVPGP